VHNNGVINAPNLATLTGVDLLYDGTGTLPINSIQTVIDGRITAAGAVATLSQLTDADGSVLSASAGGTLSLPALTHYNQAAIVNQQAIALQATGNGSLLNLGNLLALVNGTLYAAQLEIAAQAGGTVDLHSAVRIDDLPTGDTRQRSIDITADAGTVKLD